MMRMLRSALALALALTGAVPAAAQVRAAPGGVIPSLPASVVPALTAGSFAPAGALNSSQVPALTPSILAPAALAPSLVPAAPALAAPAAVFAAPSAPSAPDGIPGSRAAKPEVLHGFSELRRVALSEGGALFDGAAERPAAGEFVPAGVALQSAVRLDSPKEAASFIPSSPNSDALIRGIRERWSELGPLDLRIYRDAKGDYFRSLDITGRAEIAERFPEVQPHEAAHIRKIALIASRLELLIREEGKTPDLIVDGVVTEMKSLHPAGQLEAQLTHANAQLAAHAARHGLGRGAISIDLMHRDAVPVAEMHRAIAAFVASEPSVAADRVEVFAGADRKVFVRGADGAFRLRPAQKGAPRFVAPRSLAAAEEPETEVVVRELTEPIRRLAERGIKSKVTVYGSARIPSPAAARAALRRVVAEVGHRPRSPEARRRLADARRDMRLSHWYAVAEELGRLIATEGGGEVAVVTGGGPSIMEAANKGAFEAGGPSVGYNIILDKEQGLNAYTTPGLSYEFKNFSTRKTVLRHGAMGLVYFPGGFGTMDELFEVLTLMQTGKMPSAPIVLMGKRAYWEKILDFKAFSDMGLISPGDLSMFVFADTARQAWSALSGPFVPSAP